VVLLLLSAMLSKSSPLVLHSSTQRCHVLHNRLVGRLPRANCTSKSHTCFRCKDCLEADRCVLNVQSLLPAAMPAGTPTAPHVLWQAGMRGKGGGGGDMLDLKPHPIGTWPGPKYGPDTCTDSTTHVGGAARCKTTADAWYIASEWDFGKK